MKLSAAYIFIYSFIVCLALYIVENVYHPVYIVQMMQKILTFFIIPIAVGYMTKEWIGKFGKINRISILYGAGFGALSIVIISLAYYFLQDIITWDKIEASILARGVDKTTFIFAFIYIMFGNSLIEEYFFRGIVFRVLYDWSRSAAYVISALMFSLYHFAIFGAWFSGFVLLLAVVGLFVGGLFFAWLYRKTGGIWGAWIFHIFADLAILVIGYVEIFM